MKVSDLPDRIGEKIEVDPESGCWLWVSAISRGYGAIYWERKSRIAHRVVYAIARPDEDIDGLDLHHRCGVRECVNPDHIQPMPHKQNLEADGIIERLRNPNQHTNQTHCKHGHEFTPENTYVRPNGARQCRQCKGEYRARNSVTTQRRKAAEAGYVVMPSDELAHDIENMVGTNVSVEEQVALREAAQRLRDMPEGERIEGWARMLDPNCSCAEARQWGVDKDCGHYHDLPSYQRCTLILDKRKEGESR